MWMLSLNTVLVPLAAFWIALFGRIRAFFSQISGAWEAAATQLSFPRVVSSQCVQKGPAQIQPLWALWPSWSHDGCSMTEFIAFRPFIHSLHIEISLNARKDITGDKTKDKLLSDLISAIWNTKFMIFFCHFKWLLPTFKPKGDWEYNIYKLIKPQSNVF